jgi:hypothetical protein
MVTLFASQPNKHEILVNEDLQLYMSLQYYGNLGQLKQYFASVVTA